MPIQRYRKTTAGVAAAAAIAALAACSGDTSDPTGTADDGGGGAAPSADEVAAALEEGGDLLLWGWDSTLPAAVEAFQEEFPNVNVELANVGTGDQQYSALQNAIAAGSGVPDVAHLEYSAVPQFALAGSLADLSAFGAQDLEGDYTPGTWGSVALQDGVYGLPTDSGPMALFYNQEVFDEHGIEVPTTWDEYLEAARALQAADPEVYIADDAGDAGFTMSMIWQAGGQPFQADGGSVAVDLADEGTAQYAELWQNMLDEDLVAPLTRWTDQWYQALGDGTLATLPIGAWMPAILEGGVEAGAGKWRVAPLPQWESGENVTSENGGSALAVTEASENKALAYGLVEWINAGDGIQVRLDQGTFPATVADLNDEEFLDREFEYFGGQQVNHVLSDAASNVLPGWQYLPFQPYATSIFNDHVGQAYVSGDVPLQEGLLDWQGAIVRYGQEQGFDMPEG